MMSLELETHLSTPDRAGPDELCAVHRPVLAEAVAALWAAYFAPERDERPLRISTNKYRQKAPGGAASFPIVIRPDLQAAPPQPQSPLLYVDATLGEAGHARLLLAQMPGGIKPQLLGIDADPQMLVRAQHFLRQSLGQEQYQQRCSLVQQRFSDYFTGLRPGQLQADLILFDLGISLFHYSNASGRGFSLRPDDPDELLDMRLDPGRSEQSAADLLRSASETELAEIFWRYGELHNSRRLARQIVARRDRLELHKARKLANFLCQISPRPPKPHIHPATQVFQALRIAVNDELGQLQRGLVATLEQLRPSGLLAVITFHSLEDRIVKQQFRSWLEQGRGRWVYKNAIQAPHNTALASERSARLRVLRRMPEHPG